MAFRGNDETREVSKLIIEDAFDIGSPAVLANHHCDYHNAHIGPERGSILGDLSFFILGDLSVHADGERRGRDRIGAWCRKGFGETRL